MAFIIKSMTPERQALLAFFRNSSASRKYKKNITVSCALDLPNKFGFVKRGCIRTYLMDQEGKEITLEIVHQDMLFGVASYFNQMNRINYFVPIVDSEIVLMDSQTLLPELFAHPWEIMEMIGLAACATLPLTSTIGNLAFLSAYRRIAYTLIEIMSYFTEKQESDMPVIRLTHYQIGEIASVNRVTVTRILKQYQDLGIILLSHKKITILDRESLMSIIE